MIQRSPASALNKALFDRLKAQITTPGYDGVPDGKQPPYWALAETTARPWGSKTISGADALATVKVYSAHRGDKEVATIADAIIAAVTGSPLSLTDDWKIVRLTVEQHMVDRAETYREATIQFSFKIVKIKE